MRLSEAYHYLFFRLYKFWESVSMPKIWSDWKAVLCLDLLAMFLGLSVLCYYSVLTKANLQEGLQQYIVLTFVALVTVSNYFVFNHQERWKQIVTRFENKPDINNKVGTILVLLLVLAIIGNLVYAFHLMGQID